MNIEQLKSLQKRIQEATGADRELDCIIKAVMDGRTIREDGNNILARSTRPPHDECLVGRIDPGRHQRNFTEAWSNPRVPYYTSDPDGLGACVALQREVLPGCDWEREFQQFQIYKMVDGIFTGIGDGSDKSLSPYPCIAFLDAIVSALIAEEEARERVG